MQNTSLEKICDLKKSFCGDYVCIDLIEYKQKGFKPGFKEPLLFQSKLLMSVSNFDSDISFHKEIMNIHQNIYNII